VFFCGRVEESYTMPKTGWDYFLTLCLNAKDKQTLSELFDLFLTLEEKESLDTRFLIVKELLEQKRPQREISEVLNVSIAKITRGSTELKRTSEELKAYLKKYLV
jgi:TrpR family trp operon transcriptional repressor